MERSPNYATTSLVVLAVLGVIAALYLLKAILVPIALALAAGLPALAADVPAAEGLAGRPDGRRRSSCSCWPWCSGSTSRA